MAYNEKIWEHNRVILLAIENDFFDTEKLVLETNKLSKEQRKNYL